MSNTARNFNSLATGLSVPHNYFSVFNKNLNLSTKSFFPDTIPDLRSFSTQEMQSLHCTRYKKHKNCL